MQNLLARLVRKIHVIEHNLAPDRADGNAAARIVVFRLLRQDLGRAFQAGHGLGKLRSHIHDLKYG